MGDRSNYAIATCVAICQDSEDLTENTFGDLNNTAAASNYASLSQEAPFEELKGQNNVIQSYEKDAEDTYEDTVDTYDNADKTLGVIEEGVVSTTPYVEQTTTLLEKPKPVENEKSDTTPSDTSAAPDGGYGWVVVFAAFMNSFLFGYNNMSFALLYAPIAESLQESYGKVGWIGSVSQAMPFIPGFIYGALVIRFGTQVTAMTGSILLSLGAILSSQAPNVYVLYITFGIILGCGQGMVNISNIVIVQQYFDKKRGRASAIAQSGFTFGSFLGVLGLRYLISQYGWRGALFVTGALNLHAVAFSLILRPLKKKPKKPTSKKLTKKTPFTNRMPMSTNNTFGTYLGNSNASLVFDTIDDPKKDEHKVQSLFKEMFDFSLLKDLNFLVLCLSTMLMNVGLFCFFMHSTNRAIHYNISYSQASLIPSIIALGTAPSWLLCGFIADMKCVKRVLQYAIGMTLGGLVEITFVFSTTFAFIALHSALFGAVNGIFLSIQSTVLVDILGVAKIAKSQALLGFFIGISCLYATPLAGFLYDWTHSYNIPFLVMGSVQLAGGLLLLVAFIVRGCKTKKISEPLV